MKTLLLAAGLLFVSLNAAAVPSELTKEESAALSEMGLQGVRGAPALLDFTLDDLTGKKIQLSSYKGKVVLVNFWATWCPPCRQEMPGMEKLYQSLKGNPDFVMLAVDSQEEPETVKAFIQKNRYHFPVLLDVDAGVTAQYSVRAYPTTYLIDRKGRVVGGIVGAHEWGTAQMLTSMQKLLGMK